jgi:hypothetical protein
MREAFDLSPTLDAKIDFTVEASAPPTAIFQFFAAQISPGKTTTAATYVSTKVAIVLSRRSRK